MTCPGLNSCIGFVFFGELSARGKKSSRVESIDQHGFEGHGRDVFEKQGIIVEEGPTYQ